MKQTKPRNYSKIDKIAKSIGLKRIIDGFYLTPNGVEIDLTASDDTKIAVWATIGQQLLDE